MTPTSTNTAQMVKIIRIFAWSKDLSIHCSSAGISEAVLQPVKRHETTNVVLDFGEVWIAGRCQGFGETNYLHLQGWNEEDGE
jgi:hypothetical protein